MVMGPPTAGRITILANPANDPDTTLCTLIQTLDPGAAVPPHRHEKAEQALYFAAGFGEVTIAGHQVAAEPGVTVHVPKGVTHAIANPKDQPLSFVESTSPPGFEEAFRELGRLSSPTEETVAEILARHDILVVDE